MVIGKYDTQFSNFNITEGWLLFCGTYSLLVSTSGMQKCSLFPKALMPNNNQWPTKLRKWLNPTSFSIIKVTEGCTPIHNTYTNLVQTTLVWKCTSGQ